MDKPMNELPDLQPLETVEARDRSGHVFALVAILAVAGFLSLAVWMYRMYPTEMREVSAPLIAALAFGGAICLWAFYRLLSANYYWRTDAEGLETRSLVRRRFERWADAKSIPRIEYRLRCKSRLLPVAASVWQHMRRLGKAEVADLPEPALTFWDEIPDALPWEAEWDQPSGVRMGKRVLLSAAALLVCLGLGLAVAGLVVPHQRDLLVWAVCSWLYALCFGGMLSRAYGPQPEHISLDRRTLRARFGDRTVEVASNDVLSAGWWGEPGLLQLRTATSRIAIPLDSTRDGSSKLVLAVIRWLRTSSKPVLVAIPRTLRMSPWTSDLLSDEEMRAIDRVEVRFSMADRFGLLFLALMLTAPWVALALRRAPIGWIVGATVLATIVVSALTWWAASTYRVFADREALGKECLWWRKRVRWEDVARFTFGSKAGSAIQDTTLRWTLRDAKGRILLCLTTENGTKKQWEAFARFMYSRLAKVLPAEELSKPWLARPWSPTEWSAHW